jgi:predicted membrane channel-forming protein YqfA (hemolysin III family)
MKVNIMNKLRRMFEGNYETKTPDMFINSKIYLALSIIGCIFCLISFIISLISKTTVSCVIFLIGLLLCMNCGIAYFKRKKNR